MEFKLISMESDHLMFPRSWHFFRGEIHSSPNCSLCFSFDIHATYSLKLYSDKVGLHGIQTSDIPIRNQWEPVIIKKYIFAYLISSMISRAE